jgi:3-hydroxy-9,10-secoandrosta-1,3,5(10)-triene-9,17-dione monooxygenase reductase component
MSSGSSGAPDVPISAKLRQTFGHFATGVTIVTTLGTDGRPLGMTVNSFSSLSLEPPLVLWSLARASLNFDVFHNARHFAVHVLGTDRLPLARQFATREIDRFLGVTTTACASGIPRLSEYHACFECETHARYDGGDHSIIVGRILEIDERPGDPLLFYRGRFARIAID